MGFDIGEFLTRLEEKSNRVKELEGCGNDELEAAWDLCDYISFQISYARECGVIKE